MKPDRPARTRSASAATALSRRRSRLVAGISGVAAVALVVTLAVVSSGFDARDTPREDPAVWVARSSGQYARVNTQTAEIDTVRTVENPSAVVQSAGLSLVLTRGFGSAWVIDAATPRDLRDRVEAEPATSGASAAGQTQPTAPQPSGTNQADDEGAGGAAAIRTPEGTRDVIAAGAYVLFSTQGGGSYLAHANAPTGAAGVSLAGAAAELGSPMLLDPFAGQANAGEQSAGEQTEASRYLADAAALDADGRVALYSHAERQVRWVDAARGQFRGTSPVPEAAPGDGAQLAIVGGRWVLLDSATGALWLEGRNEPVSLDLVGTASLQGSSVSAGAGKAVFVADESGLWSVTADGRAERIMRASGVAAKPQAAGDTVVAAWLSSTQGTMWTSTAGERPLELDATVKEGADPQPVIRTNGSRALVVDQQSGMLWTVPDGRLIPVAQWDLVNPPKQATGDVITQDVTEQQPPVAVDDSFGARAGEPVLLPVLLNDYDPNRRDVLTVVPDGLGDGLSPEFGTIALTSDAQGVLLQPASSARGSGSFRYRITDGVNVSEPATVTVTIAADTVNTAPEWCPVAGCQRSWPSPEIAPGGTLVMPILDGWVDPEGDPMLLAAATPSNLADPVRALVTADGKLALRHTDGNAVDGDVAVTVRVADSRGAATERELRVRVRTGAAIALAAQAVTATVGETTLVRPLERVTGGSGSFQLVDAVVSQGALATAVNQGAGQVEVTPGAAGSSLVTVTVRDTVTEQETTGVVRVTAVTARQGFGVPPLRAFVRPLADTTIDVLQAIPSANTRALIVQSATVRDGQVRADVIEHSRIRVSGSTPDGLPGRIGSVDVTIAEGDLVAQGRLTVFQVAEASAGAIAVADTATVRAGSVVDIPVLDNDVAPPGERLVLHPVVGAPGIEGELAFASGSSVRYLAPNTPGTYTLSYTTYGASSPEHSDVGHVRVTVLPTGANRDPQPTTVTVRVAPGERVTAQIPLSGVDADGDRVRLVSVDAPPVATLTATMLPRSSSVQVAAATNAVKGTTTTSYTVRDTAGGEGRGTIRIIVTDPDSGGGAPVVYSDYVRMVRGATEPATVRPLDNDLDPAGGTLELLSVVPNVPGGSASPDYQALAARLDTSDLSKGIVRIHSSNDPGTASFKYTVRSTKSTSTADGLIVVQVSDRIGVQAPAITDTVLSVKDRAEFERAGVDVVTDRVRWASGDVAKLTLSLWGDAAGRYRVNGSSIVGSYRAQGDLVPFRLSGVDFTGAEVESYGFLIVPPLDELRLSLKPGLAAVQVAEDQSVDVPLADLLDLGSGDAIRLDDGAFATQRSQASCQPNGATSIRYTAGKEAPWNDTCTVRVRLTEQSTYTSLAVPISIVPNDPVAKLTPLTRTIAPGASETIALTDMVEWQGGRVGQLERLQWQASPAPGAFTITQNGAALSVQAGADAVPGSQVPLSITVSGAGESQAVLTLRVGEAAVDAPVGATIALQCTVGSSCEAPLVGRPGEHDPFAGKPGGGLRVVSVDGAGCAYGTLSAAGDSVRVNWADARGPGGRCTATFTVQDAQHRTGTGKIELDAQGVPQRPGEVRAVAFTESSVTLEVVLGAAQNAHPALSGVAILEGSSNVGASCTPTGGAYRCTVSGLDVGVTHSYRAVAQNAVGDSDPTENVATTWAFRTPTAPAAVSLTQLSAESSTAGTARVAITSGDATAGSFRVTIGGVSQTFQKTSDNQFTVAGVTTGESIVAEVTAISQFPHPTGDSTTGGSTLSAPSRVTGLPTIEAPALVSAPGSNTVDVTVHASGSFSTDVKFGAVSSGACVATSTSSAITLTGTPYQVIAVTTCVQNEWGSATSAAQNVQVGGAVPTLDGLTYSVATTPTVVPGVHAQYFSVTPPAPTPLPGFEVQYRVDGVEGALGGAFPTLNPDAIPTIAARQVSSSDPSIASAWSVVSPGGGAPTTVELRLDGCFAAATAAQRVSSAARSLITVTHDPVAGTIRFLGQPGSAFSFIDLTQPMVDCGP